MCHVPTKTGMSNTICIYCGSTNHTSNRCHNRPNDNREKPRSTPRNLREHGTGNIHKGFRQPQVNCHQTRFNEGLNRQHSPNYKIFGGTDWKALAKKCRDTDDEPEPSTSQ